MKRSDIWASRVNIQCLQGIFDSKVSKVILRSFSEFLISVICILKMAGRTDKWMKSLEFGDKYPVDL